MRTWLHEDGVREGFALPTAVLKEAGQEPARAVRLLERRVIDHNRQRRVMRKRVPQQSASARAASPGSGCLVGLADAAARWRRRAGAVATRI